MRGPRRSSILRSATSVLLAAVTAVTAVTLTSCASTTRSPAGSGPTFSYQATLIRIGGSGTADPPRGPSSPASVPEPSPQPTTPVPAVARAFAWADDDNLLVYAACFTVVRGISPRAALKIVAPHARVTTESAAQAAARRTGKQVIAATTRNGWTLVLEDNNFVATGYRMLRRLSRHGLATVVFNNVNADQEFLYARRGRVIRAVDPLLGTSIIGRRLPQERDLHLGSKASIDHSLALSMLLTQRLLGFMTRPSDLDLSRYSAAVVVTV